FPDERFLTERQRQVLPLIAENRTNREIALALGISLDGAKWHVSEILTALGASSRAEVGRWWRDARPARASSSPPCSRSTPHPRQNTAPDMWPIEQDHEDLGAVPTVERSAS